MICSRFKVLFAGDQTGDGSPLSRRMIGQSNPVPVRDFSDLRSRNASELNRSRRAVVASSDRDLADTEKIPPKPHTGRRTTRRQTAKVTCLGGKFNDPAQSWVTDFRTRSIETATAAPVVSRVRSVLTAHRWIAVPGRVNRSMTCQRWVFVGCVLTG